MIDALLTVIVSDALLACVGGAALLLHFIWSLR